MSRTRLLLGTMAATFVLMRAYLHMSPDTDLDVAGYNIHHLFTGLVLITLGGIPAVLLPAAHRASMLAVAVFGIGLSLALDEWLYLIVTDGTNAAYVTPVSFWGGAFAVALACLYTVAVNRCRGAGARDTSKTTRRAA